MITPTASIRAPAPKGSPLIDASLLSFVAAFVDTCGFVGLYGLFSAHVTGNFVLMGAELVNRRTDLLAKLLSFPVFIAAVGLTVVLADALRKRGLQRLGPLLAIEGALLVLAVLLPLAVGLPASADDRAALAIGTAIVAAMGMQNALMRLELASLPPTTVMTGNVTQATIDAVTLAWCAGAAPAVRDEARLRLQRMGIPMAAFVLGAAGGAGGYAWLGLHCLIAPAALLGVLAYRLSTAPSGR
jgi:uncharacterized membrane protein YoaK (UPF0700 family)